MSSHPSGLNNPPGLSSSSLSQSSSAPPPPGLVITPAPAPMSTASSSSVTIPTPGKSILKRPPPPPPSMFSLSRFKGLLPSSSSNNGGEGGGYGGGPNGSGGAEGGSSGGGVGSLWNVGSASGASGTQGGASSGGNTEENTSPRNRGSSLTGLSIASIRSSISNATSGRRSTLSSVQGEDGGQSPSSFFGGGSPGGALSGSGANTSAGAYSHGLPPPPSYVSHEKPTPPQSAKELEDRRTLKRAHFILPKLATVYPISAANPPHMPTTQEEKRVVEAREGERRRRVVRGNSVSQVGTPYWNANLGTNGRTSRSGSVSGSIRSANASGGGDGLGDEDSIPEGDESGHGDNEEEEADYWGMDKVESFYRECCESREDFPHPRISAALKLAHATTPRTVDLSGIAITMNTAAILSDVLSIEWGLRKLLFKECDLDELVLKPILHSLLITESLDFLSLASNRRLKPVAYKLIAAWLTRAHSLKFLDLSQNMLDKRALEQIAGAFAQPQGQGQQHGLESLKLDDCGLKPAGLEALAHVVRTSQLRNISLRHNRISPTGTVALALMIKDYPDTHPSGSSNSLSLSPYPSYPSSLNSANSSVTGSPASSVISLPTSPTSLTPSNSNSFHSLGAAPNAPAPGSLAARLAAAVTSPPRRPPPPPEPLPPPIRTGPLPPPPQHPAALAGVAGIPVPVATTTYTPYVPRAKRMAAARSEGNPLAPNGHVVPTFASSAAGGVTAVTARTVSGSIGSQGGHPQAPPQRSQTLDHGPSAALLDKVRQLDALPRLGALQTLDLKGNEIRNGVSYIAQVLKRNRTLKVLNLSENKLDVQGLVQIADALKYNACLETLDLSRNPCCGPALDGIQSLRTAFTLNTALKQLFLAATGLTSAGAIMLAEFLPESSALLALGLTENNIDIAGVLALNGGLKGNHVMRCLDLSIPPGDEDMARVCREIFNTCVRNTEEAERANRLAAQLDTHGRDGSDGDAVSGPGTPTSGTSSTHMKTDAEVEASAKAVWGMIDKSQLAKAIRLDDAKKSATELPGQVRECMTDIEAQLERAPASKPSSGKLLVEADANLAARAADLSGALAKLIQKASSSSSSSMNPERLVELLSLNDELTELIASRFVPKPKPKPEALRVKNGLGLDLSHIGSGINGGGAVPSYFTPNGTEDSGLLTPRGSRKGKERAEPEPEPFEKVTTPTFVLESDNEDDESAHGLAGGRMVDEPEEGEDGADAGETSPSQNERSRYWVEEEGEVFRKGQKLLGVEEMEGDFAGEELRQELLEAEVDRPPPRPIVDEFGDSIADTNSPLPMSPTQGTPTTPSTVVPDKPAPRPYIPRRRSSQASMNSVSSTGSTRSNDTVKS